MNQPNIITAEQFKQSAYQVIPIPSASKGADPIYIQIKATGIMNLLANGKIPNTLIGKVTELFGDTGKDKINPNLVKDQGENAMNVLSQSETGLQDMAGLLRVFAEASMVQPTYGEVADYMTDDQLLAVFSAMYGEVQEAESFRTN